MPRPFSAATAEQVVLVVEAVFVNRQPTEIQFVADFSDLPTDRAESALKLATDIGLLSVSGGKYSVTNPLCRYISTSDQMQKAAVLRVTLESYEPFIKFRERLVATGDAAIAAQQVKSVLQISAHREEIKDTLISLGTYSHALVTEGGGRYSLQNPVIENTLEVLVRACADSASAEAMIRTMIGVNAVAISSRDDVILPLSDALLRAKSGDSRGAVVYAGNAIDSYLTERAGRLGVNLTGANGINAKIDRFDNPSAGTNKLPKKLVNVGKYLGHIRNAADHGIDTDINSSWNIRPATGLEYVNVACSFIATTTIIERGESPEI